MSRQTYQPGPASGARIHKDGEQWTLVIVRDLRHPPTRVWPALTDPAQLREWAPFDVDRDMGTPGPVMLSAVGAPTDRVEETRVTRAEPPKLLEFSWNGSGMRWELEPTPEGTRLTLWASIDRRYIAMGAAGWQICFDVLSHHLAGDPLGRMVGMEVLKFDGWQRLHTEFSKQFGVEAPPWPPAARS